MKLLQTFVFTLSICGSILISGCDVIQKIAKQVQRTSSSDSTIVFVPMLSSDSSYSLSIPDYMSSTTMLNSSASLQAMALVKQEFAIVIAEDKESVLESYATLYSNSDDSIKPCQFYREIQLSSMKERTRFKSEPKIQHTTIGSCSADIVELHCDIQQNGESVSIGYSLGFVEGKDKLYMIMAWCDEKQYKQNKPLLDKILRSLREVPKQHS